MSNEGMQNLYMQHSIETSDGACDSYTFTPDGSGPWPAALIYMDGPGIRPALFEMAQRLADAGYFVLVPNLHYRLPKDSPLDTLGKVRLIDHMKVMRDTEAYLRFLKTRPEVEGESLRVVGYCMGGGLALSAAGTFPQVKAAASFHGGRLATVSAQSPHLIVRRTKARVYVAAAELDEGFGKEEREQVETAVQKVGGTFEVYPGVKHGFAVTGHAVYDREGSERHWTALIALFQST
jgi:carboxymethylenebutenolidase